jgi:hypothetical protein
MDNDKGGFYDITENIVFPTILDVTLIEDVPNSIKVQKDKYVNGQIAPNENYQEPFNLEATVRQQQKIIDQLLVDSLMGV